LINAATNLLVEDADDTEKSEECARILRKFEKNALLDRLSVIVARYFCKKDWRRWGSHSTAIPRRP
jgi:hypothetical protein